MTTRALCGTALGRIAGRLGSPIGDKIIPTLSEVLLNDPFDLMRSWAAQALGYTNNQLAVEQLLQACNDQSPVVSVAVNLSLIELGYGQCPSASVLTAASKTTIGTLSTASIATGGNEQEKASWKEYLERHVIFMPPVDIDDLDKVEVQQ